MIRYFNKLIKNILIIIKMFFSVCIWDVIASPLKNNNIEHEDGLPVKDLSKVEYFQRTIMKNLMFAQDNQAYWLFTR